MQLLLFTGKGGVGKTTTAAASAAQIAGSGQKVLVVSTDPAHSLADVFGAPLGAEPVEVGPGLFALQVDGLANVERSWTEIASYLTGALGRAEGIGIAAEELTVLPGAEEILALLAVRDHVASGRWDAVVVDCAPTAETLRLLALPRALQWYMERIFPTHRRMVRTLRPAFGGALPTDVVLDAILKLHTELLDVHALLSSPQTSVRLVLTPEAVVVAEARRTATALALYGYRIDTVIANRIIPAGGDDPWRLSWARSQAHQLDAVADSFPGLPLLRAAYRAEEPMGLGALTEIGIELYGDADPLAAVPTPDPMEVVPATDDRGVRFDLFVTLPHVGRAEVGLARSGDELVLTVPGHRRLLALPSVLRRCLVARADLVDGRLQVQFRPDPQRWPTS